VTTTRLLPPNLNRGRPLVNGMNPYIASGKFFRSPVLAASTVH
jgi:hypothetical protein